MAILAAIPIFLGLLVFQSAVLSRIPLLHGTADLVLLAILAWTLQERVETGWHWGVIAGIMVSFVSALPLGVPLAGYLAVVALALFLRRRVWKVPFLAMLVSTFAGTLIIHALDLVALQAAGASIPWVTAFNLFTLPSILLNLLFAIPAYALLADLARWVYPEELEV